MIIQNLDSAYKGRFQITVRNADGSIKQELPWQDNLITDNGLRVLNGAVCTTNLSNQATGGYISENCFIGDGSVNPTYSDIALTSYIAPHSLRENFYSEIEDVNTEHPNHVKKLWRYRYTFSNINNKNITEVGLGKYISTSEYILYTHALIEDSSGKNIAITVLTGEILEINYEMAVYFNVKPPKSEFNLLVQKNNTETSSTYECITRLFNINNQYNDAGIYVKAHYIKVVGYGVDTTKDTDLTVPYDFSKWSEYTVHTNNQQVSNDLTKNTFKTVQEGGAQNIAVSPVGTQTWNMSATTAALYEETHSDFTTTTSYKFSPYIFNFENGIRAMTFPVAPITNISTVNMYLLVVIAEKGSSKGLPKTNNDILSITFKTTVSRYEE